jgi:uncharacterized SAM-binding protein YcdF (DUF218 family)
MLAVVTALAGNLLLVLLGAGLVWGIHRRKPWAVFLLLLFALLTCPAVAERFLLPLEGQFPVPSMADLEVRGIRQVVVLTGGGYPDEQPLAAVALPPASAARFLAGVELCARLGEHCRLIFSGSAGRGDRDRPTALTMARALEIIDPSRTALAEARSGSTAEHPGNVAPLLEPGDFLLVTSARHMPRAMTSFRRAGLEPVPYPVDFLTGHPGWTRWLPSQGGLALLQAAWREALATLFYTLRGF